MSEGTSEIDDFNIDELSASACSQNQSKLTNMEYQEEINMIESCLNLPQTVKKEHGK